MKTRTISLAIVAVSFLVSSFAYAGVTGKANSEFEVTPVENLHLGKSAEKVWTINYSQLNKPVTIAMRIVPTGKEYIVRTDYMEVIYASDMEGFGARKMRPSMKEVSGKVNSSVLNKQQLQSQRVLTTNEVSDAYALDLIGSYLPDLLNEQYLHLIY